MTPPAELTIDEFRELVRLALEPVRAEEATLRAELLDARLDAMPEGERPTDDERADLDSRLAGAMAEERVVEVERGEPPLVHVRRLDALDARALLEKLWPRIAGEWQAHRAPVVAARLTLDDERARKDRDGRRASFPEAVPRLAAAIRGPLDELLKATGDDDGATTRAVEWLKGWGLADADVLASKRYGARMADPVDRPMMLANVVARRLWPDVRERLAEESAPAVVSRLITDIQGARYAQKTLPFEGAGYYDLKGGPKHHEPKLVGRLVPTIDPRVLSCDPLALQSLTTGQLLRWLVWSGWRQRFVERMPDPSLIIVERGWTGLARQLALKGKKAADEVYASVAALAEFRLPLSPTLNEAHNYSRLLTIDGERKARGRQAGELRLALLGPLRPGYVFEQLKDHRIPEDKRLVPMPLPEQLPAMIGKEANWGSQGSLQLLTMRELRRYAEKLFEEGGVQFSTKAWHDLADEAHLPKRMVPDVLDAWLSGQGRRPGPRFLVRSGPDRFDLAPEFAKERDLILSAAEAQIRGRNDRQAFKRRQARATKAK